MDEQEMLYNELLDFQNKQVALYLLEWAENEMQPQRSGPSDEWTKQAKEFLGAIA